MNQTFDERYLNIIADTFSVMTEVITGAKRRINRIDSFERAVIFTNSKDIIKREEQFIRCSKFAKLANIFIVGRYEKTSFAHSQLPLVGIINNHDIDVIICISKEKISRQDYDFDFLKKYEIGVIEVGKNITFL